LTDDAGHEIGQIEGSIQSPGETERPRKGEFELQEIE
jgi:hypothetical protein